MKTWRSPERTNGRIFRRQGHSRLRKDIKEEAILADLIDTALAGPLQPDRDSQTPVSNERSFTALGFATVLQLGSRESAHSHHAETTCAPRHPDRDLHGCCGGSWRRADIPPEVRH